MRGTLRMARALILGWVLAAGLPAPSAAAADSRFELCPVCVVKEGTNEPEPVKATRTHAGRVYGFCSAACARAFDADPAAFTASEFPRPAPAFTVRSLEGRRIDGATLRGKVTLLDFWATWCVPCVRNIPDLNRLHREWAPRGFQVLGISIDEGGAKKVRSFLKRHAVTYPLAIDGGKSPAWEAFRVKAVPAAFLLDAEGNIIGQWLGRVDPAEIERALAERLPAAP